MSDRIVLGSRSPRRHELLAHLIGADHILVCPPLDTNEAPIENASSVDDVSRQLVCIARTKLDDVVAQIEQREPAIKCAAILTADTVIIGFDEQQRPHVLGQPPSDDTWPDVVRDWFTRYLLRSRHLAITALCASRPGDEVIERVVTTEVTFRSDGGDWLDWYLSTGESKGKAGGYGLQGAGSLFVERIEGSPSNVIGLPLRETAEVLRQLECVINMPENRCSRVSSFAVKYSG
ncbi:MAG: Maf family protein [Planctomycetaceae bacterium]|nr:Maf family protein [Planctomycetaceae bacterium]